jgi:hypothetical protein
VVVALAEKRQDDGVLARTRAHHENLHAVKPRACAGTASRPATLVE